MIELTGLLSAMVARDASDLYINVGAPPIMKLEGHFHPLSKTGLSEEQIQQLVGSILSDEQRVQFERQLALDIGLEYPHVGRFRLNIYRQKGMPAMVVRYVKERIPSINELGLPDVLHDLVMEERGLVLVVGATGSGKSTTLAAMLDYRNQNRAGHILTIEDPIEFTHRHKQSLISQREVGIDTHSYADALKFGLREAPDVIMIGEIRDTETARQALRYAETGHLCLSTLHAANANQALDRITNLFPAESRLSLRQDLAQNLRAIVSQRLARGVDGKRVAVVEIMMNTPYIAELIEKGETDKIKEAMSAGGGTACQTFDDALYKLIEEQRISKEEGLRLADSRVNLALRFRLEESGGASRYLAREKHWLGKKADFSRYHTVCVKAKRMSLERRPDMEKVLTEAITRAVTDRGYLLDSQNPDIVIQYAFGLRHENGFEAQHGSGETDKANEPQTEGGLAIQAKEKSTGEVLWTLVASRPLGQQLRSQEEINVEISNLLGSFPLAQKAS